MSYNQEHYDNQNFGNKTHDNTLYTGYSKFVTLIQKDDTQKLNINGQSRSQTNIGYPRSSIQIDQPKTFREYGFYINYYIRLFKFSYIFF